MRVGVHVRVRVHVRVHVRVRVRVRVRDVLRVRPRPAVLGPHATDSCPAKMGSQLHCSAQTLAAHSEGRDVSLHQMQCKFGRCLTSL